MNDITKPTYSGSTLNNVVAQREAWLDQARGIGVILVVFGHMLLGLVGAHMFPSGPIERWIDYTLYTFHMPLFFYLSALNVEASLRHGRRSFLVAKVWTIAYPYVLWSLIQGGILIMVGGDANAAITPGNLAAIWYQPIGQFWFLYALMICHVFAALVPDRRVLLILAASCLLIFEFSPDRAALAPTFLGLTLHHVLAYALGIYRIGSARNRVSAKPSVARVGLLVLAAMGFATAVVIGAAESSMDPLAPASLPAAVLGIATVVMLSRMSEPSHLPWLMKIGTMSMTIYILHILAGSGTRVAILKLHLVVGPWVSLAICTTAGVLLPILAHIVMRRWNVLGPLGFGRQRSPAPVIAR